MRTEKYSTCVFDVTVLHYFLLGSLIYINTFVSEVFSFTRTKTSVLKYHCRFKYTTKNVSGYFLCKRHFKCPNDNVAKNVHCQGISRTSYWIKDVRVTF